MEVDMGGLCSKCEKGHMFWAYAPEGEQWLTCTACGYIKAKQKPISYNLDNKIKQMEDRIEELEERVFELEGKKPL